MANRNSLKGCLHTMATLFAQDRHTSLVITCNPQGKYYTLLTPAELQKQKENPNKRDYRVVLHVSKSELSQLLKTPQQSLQLDS